MLGVQIRQEELKVSNFLDVVSKPAFRLLIRHHEVADHRIDEHTHTHTHSVFRWCFPRGMCLVEILHTKNFKFTYVIYSI